MDYFNEVLTNFLALEDGNYIAVYEVSKNSDFNQKNLFWLQVACAVSMCE